MTSQEEAAAAPPSSAAALQRRSRHPCRRRAGPLGTLAVVLAATLLCSTAAAARAAKNMVNIAGGSDVSASSTCTAAASCPFANSPTSYCAGDNCSPAKVVDVEVDPSGHTMWVSLPRSCGAGGAGGSNALTEYLVVNWTRAQEGSVPISAVAIHFGPITPNTTTVTLFNGDADTTGTAATDGPTLSTDGEEFTEYAFDGPVVATHVRFDFKGLTAGNQSLCYAIVDEIKAYTTFETTITTTLSPGFIALIVLALAVVAALGAVLFLRQRQLAQRMGVKIVGTDGIQLKQLSSS